MFQCRLCSQLCTMVDSACPTVAIPFLKCHWTAAMGNTHLEIWSLDISTNIIYQNAFWEKCGISYSIIFGMTFYVLSSSCIIKFEYTLWCCQENGNTFLLFSHVKRWVRSGKPTQVLRPVSRAVLVWFGAFWKQPKKHLQTPAKAAASRRYSTQHRGPLPDFLL